MRLPRSFRFVHATTYAEQRYYHPLTDHNRPKKKSERHTATKPEVLKRRGYIALTKENTGRRRCQIEITCQYLEELASKAIAREARKEDADLDAIERGAALQRLCSNVRRLLRKRKRHPSSVMDCLYEAIGRRFTKVNLKSGSYEKLAYAKPLGRSFRELIQDRESDSSEESDHNKSQSPARKKRRTESTKSRRKLRSRSRESHREPTHILDFKGDAYKINGTQLIFSPWHSLEGIQKDQRLRSRKSTVTLIARTLKEARNLSANEKVDLKFAGKPANYNHEKYKKERKG